MLKRNFTDVSPLAGLVVCLSLFSSHSAHAILGNLLPESELPDYVCSLKAEKWIETEKKKDGTTDVRVKPNRFYCSAVLVGKDRIHSAAHCHPTEIAKFVDQNPFDPRESVRYRIEGKITVECGKNPTPETTRVVDVSAAEKNPFFSVVPGMTWSVQGVKWSSSIVAFDESSWKLPAPITKITPIAVEYDFNHLIETAKYNFKIQRCRSFGFGQTEGRDEKGEVIRDEKGRFAVTSGFMTGAITPITAVTERVIFSDLAGDDNGVIVAGGRTGHGDSGGALVCQTQSGNDLLVGIISRGGDDFPPMADRTAMIDVSRYALPTFNGDWLKAVDAGTYNAATDEMKYMINETRKLQKTAAQSIATYKDPVAKTLKEKQKILKKTSRRDPTAYAAAAQAVRQYEGYVNTIAMSEELLPLVTKDFNESLNDMTRDQLLEFYAKFYDIHQNVQKAGRNMLL